MSYGTPEHVTTIMRPARSFHTAPTWRYHNHQTTSFSVPTFRSPLSHPLLLLLYPFHPLHILHHQILHLLHCPHHHRDTCRRVCRHHCANFAVSVVFGLFCYFFLFLPPEGRFFNNITTTAVKCFVWHLVAHFYFFPSSFELSWSCFGCLNAQSFSCTTIVFFSTFRGNIYSITLFMSSRSRTLHLLRPFNIFARHKILLYLVSFALLSSPTVTVV